MQKIKLNTGLNSFILIDSISHADGVKIEGIKTFSDASAYLGLESLAQLGAFHVRYLIGFERHAFLLKISRCSLPAQENLNGTYAISGRLANRSLSAFSYVLQARKGGKLQIQGEFLFATVDYEQVFKKEILKDHYRNVFSCLKNDTKEG